MRKIARRIFSALLLTMTVIVSVFSLSACDLSAFMEQPIEIANTAINENGELIVYYSDGTSKNLGTVVGKDGKDGEDGIDIGVRVTDAQINESGELILYYSDGTSENLGTVVGKDGEDGEDAAEPQKNITVNVTGDAESAASAVSAAAPSVVSIITNFKDAFSTSAAVGSGVIYSLDKATGDALIITNFHLLYNNGAISKEIGVFVYGSPLSTQVIEAEFVGGSMREDIALLQVKGSELLKSSIAKAVTFADSDRIYPGDTAIAIGNPQGKGISATYGKVNIPSETVKTKACDDRTEVSLRVIRMDTAVNGGNSGGGLFDGEGKLIGIVNLKSVDENIENIGYALPGNKVRALIENIKYHCLDGDGITPFKPTFGITIKIVESKAEINDKGLIDILETIEVTEVTPATPAEGVFLVGDRLLSITVNGETTEITKMHHLTDPTLNLRPGDTAYFKVLRDGVETDLEITPPKSAYNPV